jgi:hypothetical protein
MQTVEETHTKNVLQPLYPPCNCALLNTQFSGGPNDRTQPRCRYNS